MPEKIIRLLGYSLWGTMAIGRYSSGYDGIDAGEAQAGSLMRGSFAATWRHRRTVVVLCCTAVALVCATAARRYKAGSSTLPRSTASRLRPQEAYASTLLQQPTRLRITNGCQGESLWLAHTASQMNDAQNIKLQSGQSHDFAVPDGLSSTRFWPKFTCNEQGNACAIGDSGGPGQACDAKLGCGPPIDTKFEATFGHHGKPCNTSADEYAGCDFVDVSLVDGYTVPFKLIVRGDCTQKYTDPIDVATVEEVIDCSALVVSECPISEDLGGKGSSVSLRAVHPSTNEEYGCYSPCTKLTYGNWGNTLAQGASPQQPGVHEYCCPTPPETVKSCRAGPANRTTYVDAMHRLCPAVYAYAYDDTEGLHHCPAGTKYEMVFYCPAKGTHAGAASPFSPVPVPAPQSLVPTPTLAPAMGPWLTTPTPAPTGWPWQTPATSAPGFLAVPEQSATDAAAAPAVVDPALGCSVGQAVQCPFNQGAVTSCAGNSCCADGTTCPSAEPGFSCTHGKWVDCIQ